MTNTIDIKLGCAKCERSLNALARYDARRLATTPTPRDYLYSDKSLRCAYDAALVCVVDGTSSTGYSLVTGDTKTTSLNPFGLVALMPSA